MHPQGIGTHEPFRPPKWLQPSTILAVLKILVALSWVFSIQLHAEDSKTKGSCEKWPEKGGTKGTHLMKRLGYRLLKYHSGKRGY